MPSDRDFAVREDSPLDHPPWEDQLIGKRIVSDNKIRPCYVCRYCAEPIVPDTEPALMEPRKARSTTATTQFKRPLSPSTMCDTPPTCYRSRDTHLARQPSTGAPC